MSLTALLLVDWAPAMGLSEFTLHRIRMKGIDVKCHALMPFDVATCFAQLLQIFICTCTCSLRCAKHRANWTNGLGVAALEEVWKIQYVGLYGSKWQSFNAKTTIQQHSNAMHR